jgi:dienelactone hydrolase
MGGRLGIHFVAATPAVRAFVAYYPSVRDEEPTKIRPRHPCDAAREIKCPAMILYGGHDQHSTFPVQQRVMESFHSNGNRWNGTISTLAIMDLRRPSPMATNLIWRILSGRS